MGSAATLGISTRKIALIYTRKTKTNTNDGQQEIK
jgi:hypothetical protein